MKSVRKYPGAPTKIGLGFVFSNLERALNELLAVRRFGETEMQEVEAYFGREQLACVYCDSEAVTRWDHLLPVRAGGETVLGNLVPACARCDDSKQNLSVEDWWESGRKYAPPQRGITGKKRRLRQLTEYAKHFAYKPRVLEDRLTEHELQRLEKIRSKARALREEMKRLTDSYQKRCGSG